ncbi:uncharacterized protein TDEL_0E00320 [Torulaspora delbrueckii]|uniref:Putative peptidase domain-containing protein n=1 Tax=Torulaspora delbrueckii TaxID=4950 RepID=G8ZUI1_TORDE|nr:hypothetical protein TDEL_0E00320 [Torulaspora delbrueckii]CCE92275.1 hypothetical protein TDEL_0E00320 [Torulaspora delbrueckii]
MKLTSLSLLAFTALGESLAAPVLNSNSSIELETSLAEQFVSWPEPTFPKLYHTCNTTNTRMLNSAFKDSVEATAVAKRRLLKFGVDDAYYKRWFGDGSIFSVMGVLDHLIESSKEGVLFRCDDIDGLCAENPDYYAGHHRESAPSETVICDYYYRSKRPLSTVCFDGTITDVGPTHYAGIDLLHRYLHVPSMNLDFVGEFAEDLEEILEYAESNSTYAVRNADSYLYYIADVYTSSVVPGGCLGDI